MEQRVAIGLVQLIMEKIMVGKYWGGVEQTTQVQKLDLNGNRVLLKQLNTGFHQ